MLAHNRGFWGASHPRWPGMLNMFLGMETGEHVSHPAAEIYSALAYRLEPGMERSGIYSMDGEVIEYGPVQGVVAPRAARILSGGSGSSYTAPQFR